MDIKKTFATDRQLEEDGAWFDVGDGGRVKVARAGNQRYRKLLRALTRGRIWIGQNRNLDPRFGVAGGDAQPRYRAVVALPRCRFLIAVVLLARCCSRCWRLRLIGSPRHRSMRPPEHPLFRAAGWW